MIVDFAQVGENDGFETAVVDGFEELKGVRVGKMAVTASYALLEMPGIRAVEQEIQIVIGFQDQSVATLEPCFHQLCGDSQVGAHPKPGGSVLDDETDGLFGIV
jgi:hypothetical protein